MNPAPDPRCLLDDLLAGPAPTANPFAPVLRAVRARRRRRQLAPVAAALAVVVLAGVWLAMPWSAQETNPSPLAVTAPVADRLVLERVRSLPLTATERLSTAASLAAVTRLHSEAVDALRASDEELLALAGGRGVGLFRVNGRTELLFAGMGRPSAQ